MDPNQRLVSLDYLRGFAALGVVVGHLTWPLTNFPTLTLIIGPEYAKAAVELGARAWIAQVYRFMPSSQYFVHCFFILSGFVIQLSLKLSNPKGFLIQRAFRIYPTFWISVIFAMLLAVASGRNLEMNSESLAELSLLKDNPLNPVIWTLVIEVRYYAVVAVLFAIGLRYESVTAIFALGLFACALLELAGPAPEPSTLRIFLSLFFYLAWLHTGALIFQIWSSDEAERKRAVLTFAIHISFFVFCFLLLSSGTAFSRATQASLNSASMSPALLTVTVLVFSNQYFSPRLPVLKYLGDISYPLYLLHIPVGWLVFVLMFEKLGAQVAVMCGLFAAILASAVVHSFIEGPANDLGKALSRIKLVKKVEVAPSGRFCAGKVVSNELVR